MLTHIKRPRKSGITLLEILIAFALLGISYSILVTTFMGMGRQVPFTEDHFSAMFLLQPKSCN